MSDIIERIPKKISEYFFGNNQLKSTLLIYLLSTCFCSPILLSQSITRNLQIERISTDQGLSQSTVECIYRDSRGFMWFGTEEGLNRYDGYNFTVYKNDHRNPLSLSNEVVFSIFEDSYENLWVGTRDGGLNLFNRQKETFEVFKHDAQNKNSISDNKISSIYESPGLPGVLWIGTETGGLNKFDVSERKFTHYKFNSENPNSISSNRIRVIYESPAQPGILWIATGDSGLNKFNYIENSFTHFKFLPGQSNCLSSNEIWALYEISNMPGILWIGTKNGLNKFDIKNVTFTHYKNDPLNKNSLSHNEVTSLIGSPDEPGVIYIGTMGGGLNKMILPEGSYNSAGIKNIKFIHFKNQSGNLNSLSSDNIISLFEDKNQPGVMWVGTFDAGVNKIYKSNKKFTHYKNEPDNTNSLINNVVWSICQDSSGILWVGTHEGLSEIHRYANGEIKFVNHTHLQNNKNSLSSDIVTTIVETSFEPGVLWIGTYGGGLTKLIPGKNEGDIAQFIHYKHTQNDPSSISSNAILNIIESRAEPGILWIGTARGGLNKFIIEENKFISYKHNPADANSISNNDIHTIWESINEPDILWIGTIGGGLNKFNIKSETFTSFQYDLENTNSLSSDIVLSIYQSSKFPETLWIGTAEGGLNKLEISSGLFTHFTTRNGLPNNIINGILEDSEGKLWISTNNGLSRFDIKSNTFRNYDVQDGLQENEFNGNAYFASKNGELFFGGMNGFNSFYPSEIKDNPNIPPVIVTDFKIFNRSVLVYSDLEDSGENYSDLIYLEKSITETAQIELSYRHNFFSFDFAALDFAAPNKNQYAHKMEGFDDEWIFIGNRRFASYTNLDPGEYMFRIKGANNDGIWNEEGTSIKIIIHPPFWKTWWFLTIFWTIMAVTILGTVRYITTRKLKKQIEKLEREREMEKERTRISRDMHDEVGSSLTEIAIVSEIVKKNIDKPDEVVGHLNNISSQIAEIIDNISQIIWAINPKNDPLDNLISYLRQFGKNYLSKADIKCNFETEEKIPDFHLSAEVRRNVFLVLKEALNNIVKHSCATEVSIRISVLDSKMTLEVIDNGKGIEKKNGFGNGLINMQKRIEDINGKFDIESEPGKGTNIKLALPLYK